VAACALALATAGAPARADAPATTGKAVWQSECGSCHVAYPAYALSAASWRAMIDSLDDHYGVDASLEAGEAAAVLAWLQAGAGRERDATPDAQPPRISETRWFRDEHDEVGPAVVARPAVGSYSNCAACHRGAAEGRYDEHEILIPR